MTIRLTLLTCVLLFFAVATSAQPAASPPRASGAGIPALFQQGEAALRNGDLDHAEQAFRKVLTLDPQSAGPMPTWASS